MPDVTAPLVAVIMGSKSDWETMRHADEMLTQTLEKLVEQAGFAPAASSLQS